MKKILLAAINARYSHSNLALRYLREMAEPLPLEIKLKEFSINQDPGAIAEAAKEENPAVIALSVYIWNSALCEEIIKIFEKENTPLLLGGPEVSYNPERWLNFSPAVRWVITGPGEEAFLRLAESNFTLEPGILTGTNSSFRQVPFPYREEDLAALKHRYIYYEASRGCPFRCSYCLSSRRDQKLQLRDLEKVKEELVFMVRHNAGTIKFVDRSFNADKNFSREIWRYCIENFSPGDARFHFEVFPSLLEEEDFELLSRAPEGLFQFEIGIQSIHDRTVEEIDRPGSWSKTEPKVRRIIAPKNIHVHVDLIAGLPFETYDHIKKSFNALAALGADHLQLGFLKVLPGTVMKEKSEAYGLTHETKAPYMIEKNNWLSGKEMNQLREIARLLDIYGNSGRFRITSREVTSLFETPFEAWESLAKMIKEEKGTPTDAASWEERATLLLRLAKKHFLEEEPFLRDCLSYDWITLTGRHRFPAFLDTGELTGKRKRVLLTLKSKNSDGTIKLPGGSCTVEELRRAAVFFPATRQFRSRYLESKEILFFLPSHNIFLYFFENELLTEKGL